MVNERIKELQAEQEPFDMNDHPPHRLCECRKCMEYFTPLPDCDAFAASGKPIAGQTNTQLMEGYRIGLAEMREKCAKVCDFENHLLVGMVMANEAWSAKNCAAAIRAINFEGDTGFRPVSEMVAEHKQAAAIEKAKMRKAEQEPVAWGIDWGKDSDQSCVSIIKKHPNGTSEVVAVEYSEHPVSQEPVATVVQSRPDTAVIDVHTGNAPLQLGTLLYAAPVRTKDLTDSEIAELWVEGSTLIEFARAVIAKDREKNK